MHGLQITDLKQLFGTDEAFVAYSFEKFQHDDLQLDVAGNHDTMTWLKKIFLNKNLDLYKIVNFYRTVSQRRLLE